jgi:hypothetical protein
MGRTHRAWKRWGKRSGFENKIAIRLDEISGINYKYEDRPYKYVKLLCKHCGKVADSGTYTPDFNFYTSSGDYIFTLEAKGRFDGADRAKLKAVIKANPDIDLRMLFQKDQPICKGSKTKYSTWCEKQKIPFAIGLDLPLDWILQAKGE